MFFRQEQSIEVEVEDPMMEMNQRDEQELVAAVNNAESLPQDAQMEEISAEHAEEEISEVDEENNFQLPGEDNIIEDGIYFELNFSFGLGLAPPVVPPRPNENPVFNMEATYWDLSEINQSFNSSSNSLAPPP